MSKHSWDCAAQTAHACDCGLDDLLDHDPTTCVTTFLQSDEAVKALFYDDDERCVSCYVTYPHHAKAGPRSTCPVPSRLASLLEEMKK